MSRTIFDKTAGTLISRGKITVELTMDDISRMNLATQQMENEKRERIEQRKKQNKRPDYSKTCCTCRKEFAKETDLFTLPGYDKRRYCEPCGQQEINKVTGQ